jgi:hypothetical protein
MDDQILEELADELASNRRERLRFLLGEVTDTDPLSVIVGSSSTATVGMRGLNTGDLEVGDRVVVASWRSSSLVLGSPTASPSGGGGIDQDDLDAAVAGLQPLSTDLTAIDALTTTTLGRSLLAIANAAAGRTILDAAQASHTHSEADVTGLVADLLALDTAIGALDTEVVALQGDVSDLDTLKADLASPIFTGNPQAPTPAAGDNDVSVATTAFVQQAATAAAAGLKLKPAVLRATSAPLPAHTRSGNVLTASANGLLTIDGAGISSHVYRVLVKDEGAGAHLENGLYDVTSPGSVSSPWVLTRASDADASDEVTNGILVDVLSGTANGGKRFYLSTSDPIVLNATALTFTELVVPAPEAPAALSYGTGWGTAASEDAVRYYKDRGRVWLSGAASRSSGTGTTIGTLPAGYRPTTTNGAVLVVPIFGGVSTIVISTAGVITASSPTVVNYLDGVSFVI